MDTIPSATPDPNHVEARQVLPPLVSIIVTNFNYAQFLESALQSVREQTYKEWECVIVDDASTDNSHTLICNYLEANADPRLRYHRMDVNSGQLAASMAGLERTRGGFVVFLDADDLLFPDFLDVHVRAHLNSAYSAGVTASDMLLIDGASRILEGTYTGLKKERLDQAGQVPRDMVPEIGADGLLHCKHTPSLEYINRYQPHSFAATSSLMFRRSILELAAPRDTSIARLHSDFYLTLFSHLISGTLIISSAHSGYRIHGANGFSKSALGGGNFVGVFSDEIKESILRSISSHVIEEYDNLSRHIHPHILKYIAKKYLKKSEILERVELKHSARANIVRAGRISYAWRKWYYRWQGK